MHGFMAAVLFCAGCAATPAEAVLATGACETRIEAEAALARALDPIVNEASDAGFAGQVALMHEGVIVYRRAVGFADHSHEIAVTHDTRFHTASIGKYFTAALALAAVEQDRLALDQSAASFFPAVDGLSAAITVRDLLAHRSGLGSSYAAENAVEARAAVAAIAAASGNAGRGGAFRYSNDGYDLLAAILEAALGERYENALRHMLLDRACLRNVAFWGEVDLRDPHTVAQPPSGFPAQLSRRNYGMLGSAGVLISATDLLRWQHSLRSGQLLGSGALEELYRPRGAMSLGEAVLGAFLLDHPELGRVISARGAEDWGDNAYLNDYVDCGLMLAVVTSSGPAEDSGRPRFRDSLLQAIEPILAQRCTLTAQRGSAPH